VTPPESAHSPLSPALLARVAEQFKALAEPLRLRIMNELFAGERTVGDLAVAVDSSIANVSKHLGLLHQAGWVQRRKAGVAVYYALTDERAIALCELMCERVRQRAAADLAVATAPAPRRQR
jgi:DNA-binding transcriptional ArsR family regulator